MVNPRLINLAERLGNEVLPREDVIEPAPEPESPAKVSNTQEYIILENIACTDAKGKVFEQYPQLLVKKDIERDGQQQINHKPYDWVQYFEDKGLFLPSFALSCNILSTLYSKRSDAEIKQVLMQYKDHGAGYGWHAQNSVVDWGRSTIIHYPTEHHFSQKQGKPINEQRPAKELPFKRKEIKDMPLEKALKNENLKEYIQNLTGLRTPETLLEIANYFGKPAHVWTSSGKEKCAAWLGWDSGSFDLDTVDYLYGRRCCPWGTCQAPLGARANQTANFINLSIICFPSSLTPSRFFLWSGLGLHAPSP